VEPAKDTGSPLGPQGCFASRYARHAFGVPLTPEPLRPLRQETAGRPSLPDLARRLHKISHLFKRHYNRGLHGSRGLTAHLTCTGKGRKQRATPLTTDTAKVLRAWMNECPGQPNDPLFPNPRGGPLSRDAISRIVARHATNAARTCPSLTTKKPTPHVLRHSCAVQLLHAGIDITVIALWLGHESIRTTDIYQHADLSLKERALARTAPAQPRTPRGRYRPPDDLLAFLETL
jgi:AraC-like DNA-binding protein